jgi:sugar lactone lactonase YvrE
MNLPSFSPPRLPLRLPIRESLLLATGLMFTVAIRAQTVNLTVDTTKTVRTVDERVFGANAVLWDPQTSDAKTIALCTSAGIRAIRIPGGGMADDYNWENHMQISTSQNWPEGFNVFAPLITGLNSQVFVTVNYGSGTAQEAAAWVAYANANATLQGTSADVSLGVDSSGFNWRSAGYWSALRASAPLAVDDGQNFLRLNQSAPFGLKYWEVGNECYGTWEYDIQTVKNDPVEYGTRFALYYTLMKQVDPTIRIGAVATTSTEGPYNYPNEAVTDPVTLQQQTGWVPVMLSTMKKAGVMPDYLICHRYEQNAGQEDDATLLQLASAAATSWSVDAALLRGPLNDYFGTAAANVELCVTENNSVHNNPGKQMNSLVNGLYLADSLGSLLQTEFNSCLWWDLRNGPNTNSTGTALAGNMSSSLYGWRMYGDYGILSLPSSLTGEATYYDAYPTYYVMKLLANFVRGGDTVVHAASDNPLLAVYAAQHADGSLSLLVINKSPSTIYSANISLTSFVPIPTATVYSYGIPQDTAAQMGIGSTDIATSLITNAASAFPLSVAPYSAVVLSLQPAPAAPTISSQPKASQTVTQGTNVTFSVVANSNPAPTYQWQVEAPGTTTWANLSDNGTYSGSLTATLTVSSTPAGLNGYAFQCVLSNTNGTATRTQANLVVEAPLAIVTQAGQAGISGHADGTGSASQFSAPAEIAVDSSSNSYIADTDNDTIRMITPAGIVTTLAGQVGVSGYADGTGTAALFNHPSGITVDGSGNAYIADTNNNTIRKLVIASGAVTTVAGQAGVAGSADGVGTAASFNGPSGIAVDSTGNLYVSDTLNFTIRKVTSAGAVTMVAGGVGASGFTDATGTAARFHGPQGLTLDSSGNLFVADTNNNAIREFVPSTGVVSTVAGQSGVAGNADGANSQAQFHYPSSVAADLLGNLYVVDTDNHLLREITAGAVRTLGGLAGTSGSTDGVGTAARFNYPTGVAVHQDVAIPAGLLPGPLSPIVVYVADTTNNTIRLAVAPVAPQIASQPQSQSVAAGANVTFTVVATGSPVPTYQWYYAGSLLTNVTNQISGATTNTLSLTNVQSGNAGNYTVTVTNSVGSSTSNAAQLTVTSITPTPAPSGGGGGGGAPSLWFCGGLGLLALARRMVRRR